MAARNIATSVSGRNNSQDRRSTSRRSLGWLCFVAAAFVAGATSAEVTPSVAARATPDQAHVEWRRSMAQSAGKGSGCFRADYPELEWKKVACTTAPLHPYAPRSGAGRDSVGGGVDYVVQMPGSLPITWSEGLFAGVTAGSESDGTANTYSLQLNSNYFQTAACGTYAQSNGCIGWQQYVYQNNPANSAGTLFMQYWLVYYPSPCPGGFTYFAGAAGQASGCYMNSAAINAPLQTITNLGELALGGYATSGGDDEAQLYDNGSIYSTSGVDSVLYLGSGDTWTSAEFNVVGLNDGSQATFSSGTLLTLNTLVSTGQASTTPVPTCSGDNAGTTAETNNLSLSSVCCPYAASTYGSAYPYIYVQEGYGLATVTSCPLPVPNVTVSGGTYTAANAWKFSFSWPSVTGATYYNMYINGAAQSITGNTSSVSIICGHTDVVTFSSCNASGCGLTEEVLDAHNTKSCSTN